MDLNAVREIVGTKAKGRISKWVFKENKARQIFQKTNISCPPPHLKRTRACISGDKKCSFSSNFGVLCFLETPVLRFALLQTRCSSFSLVCIGFKYFLKISEIVIPLLRFLFQSGDGADMLHVAPIITLTLLSIALRLWGKSRSARLHISVQHPANNCNWGLI